MTSRRILSLKIVRWTGWLLVPVVLFFLLTGYAITGRYGLGVVASEETALTLHRLLHPALLVLVLAHVIPSIYLALLRWGWIKTGTED